MANVHSRSLLGRRGTCAESVDPTAGETLLAAHASKCALTAETLIQGPPTLNTLAHISIAGSGLRSHRGRGNGRGAGARGPHVRSRTTQTLMNTKHVRT